VHAHLIVNPKATATTERTREMLVRALGGDMSISVACTEYRGHATGLARDAADRGADLVIALGGDGTVNEVVNGLLAHGPHPALPRLGVVPCGWANVFARALGLPNHPVEATERLLAALQADRRRSVSVGVADDRYFTFCAGIGIDAAVVRIVEERRAGGRRASDSLYVRAALRHYLTSTRPKHPPIELQLSDGTALPRLHMAIITNTSPWTYLGKRPITPTPRAGFDTGLDLFGLSTLDTLPVFRSAFRLLAGSQQLADERWAVSLHDLSEFTVTVRDPLDFQLDGDYLGRRSAVRFRAVGDALQVAL
jgi:diacylglycerol kinase family enzyme